MNTISWGENASMNPESERFVNGCVGIKHENKGMSGELLRNYRSKDFNVRIDGKSSRKSRSSRCSRAGARTAKRKSREVRQRIRILARLSEGDRFSRQ